VSPRRDVRVSGAEHLHAGSQLDDLPFNEDHPAVAVGQQHLVDFLRVVVARGVVDDDRAVGEPGLRVLDPALHGPAHDPAEQFLDCVGVLGVVLVLVEFHPLGVQAAVGRALLEIGDCGVVDLLVLAVELRDVSPPARGHDRDDDLRADVAAEQQGVSAVELRRGHELLEAHLGTVQVRGEENGPLALAAGDRRFPAQQAHQ